MTNARYTGRCFCGEVEFEVTGAPAAMGYCHCESCRHWSAGPVNAFTLWDPQALRVTKGAANIGTGGPVGESLRDSHPRLGETRLLNGRSCPSEK